MSWSWPLRLQQTPPSRIWVRTGPVLFSPRFPEALFDHLNTNSLPEVAFEGNPDAPLSLSQTLTTQQRMLLAAVEQANDMLEADLRHEFHSTPLVPIEADRLLKVMFVSMPCRASEAPWWEEPWSLRTWHANTTAVSPSKLLRQTSLTVFQCRPRK